MGLLEKLKNTFFEEEYVEVEEEEEQEKKKKEKAWKKGKEKTKEAEKEPETPIAKKVEPSPLVVEETKEEPQEEPIIEKKEPEIVSQRDNELLKPDNGIQFFEDEDFVEVSDETSVPSVKREERKIYGGDPAQIYDGVAMEEAKETKPYSSTGSGKTGFKPTPIISPIYGILDKNYRKEELVEKKDKPSSYVSRKNVDLDFVRKKAFGTLEDDIVNNEVEEPEERPSYSFENEEYENSLLYDMTDTEEAPSVKKVTIADAEEYFEDLGLEYNVDYKDEKYEKATGRRSRITKEEVSDKPTKKEKETAKKETSSENNLFDLVDSVYEEKE